MHTMNERQKHALKMLEAVLAALLGPDDQTFSPTYADAILDSYDGPLVKQLVQVDYEYSRIRKKGQLRRGSPSA
jgi:hypothetical protein